MKNGQAEGRTARRHTSAEFVKFLAALVGKAKWAREIHIVLDNLSAHKTAAVEDFLAEHPKVRFHFAPTYSSWLNQVELWFAKIERDVIARGVFTSVGDLRRKIMHYIRAYSRIAGAAAAAVRPCTGMCGLQTNRESYPQGSGRRLCGDAEDILDERNLPDDIAFV